MGLFCRDKDYSRVSSHREAYKEIPASGELPGGGDGSGLSVHHVTLHSEAEFQCAGQCSEISPCSALITCFKWRNIAHLTVKYI